jgi:hypothetical protein
MPDTCPISDGRHNAVIVENQLNLPLKIGFYSGQIQRYGGNEDAVEMLMPSPASIQNCLGHMAIV